MMTNNGSPLPQMSPPQMTPPGETQPPQEAPSKRAAWPTAIGVISIVWASLGLICTPLSMLGNKFNPEAKEMQDKFPDWYITYLTAGSLAGIALAILLLVAGICLLKRVRAARRLHVTYAGVSMVLAVVGLVIVITVLFPSLRESDMSKAAVIGGIAGGIIGTAVGMAWPIFLLVWFSLRKIRQQVQQW